MQDERRMSMKSKPFNRYYLFSYLGVLIASYYPLSMGVRVITDMLANGTVMKETIQNILLRIRRSALLS